MVNPVQQSLNQNQNNNQDTLGELFNNDVLITIIGYLNCNDYPTARFIPSLRTAINQLSIDNIKEINLAFINSHESAGELFREQENGPVRFRSSITAASNPNTSQNVLNEIVVRRLAFFETPAGQVANNQFGACQACCRFSSSFLVVS